MWWEWTFNNVSFCSLNSHLQVNLRCDTTEAKASQNNLLIFGNKHKALCYRCMSTDGVQLFACLLLLTWKYASKYKLKSSNLFNCLHIAFKLVSSKYCRSCLVLVFFLCSHDCENSFSLSFLVCIFLLIC